MRRKSALPIGHDHQSNPQAVRNLLAGSPVEVAPFGRCACCGEALTAKQAEDIEEAIEPLRGQTPPIERWIWDAAIVVAHGCARPPLVEGDTGWRY